MSDLLGIASSAVTAYQLALGTVSNNIANVSTDGYTRQSVEINAGTPRQLGTAFIGSGVVFDRVKRQYDAFAEGNLRTSTSELASQQPMVDYANRVIDIMGSESAGLTSSLDQFFASARALTTDPASTVLRGELFRGAQGVAARFGQISSQLDMVDTETREAVAAGMGEINTISTQLAAINTQLAKVGQASKQPSELLDQRDRLLRQLSEWAGIRTSFAPSGAVTVALGGTINKDVIVAGNAAVRVGYTSNVAAPERIGLMLDPYGPKPALLSGVTSGKLAGLLTFRDQVLESTRGAVDFIASTFVSEVNTQHKSGVDAYGQIGGDLFKIDPAAEHVAGGVSMAIDDAMRIAAAAQFRVVENSLNTGLADATVSFKTPAPAVPPVLNEVLVNNPHPSAARNVDMGSAAPLTAIATVPAGLHDVTIYLNDASGDQQLQLVTRDGRHLLGTALSQSQKALLMSQPSMVSGASYSDQYLGASGASGYKDMDIFYGARAEQRVLQQFDGAGNAVTDTSTGERVASGLTGLAAGALTINGQAMPALVPVGATVQATDVAAWVNDWAAGLVPSQGITARAFNEIHVPAANLKNTNALEINGVSIDRPALGAVTVDAWMLKINALSAQTKVLAQASPTGELVLTNMNGYGGRSINIGPAGAGNALGLDSKTYNGQVEIIRSVSNPAGGTAVDIGFGTGKPSDLAKLGIHVAPEPAPAVLLSGRIASDFVGLTSGTLTLNGLQLPALTPAGASVQADEVAQWINGWAAGTVPAQGISARAFTEIRVPGVNLKNANSLQINNIPLLRPSVVPATADAWLEQINAVSSQTKVLAQVSPEGELVLSNVAGEEGKPIVIGPSSGGNALGIEAKTYGGQVEITRALVNDQGGTSIEFGFGSGAPSDLAKLGLRTAAYLRGSVADDVVVFASDTAGSRARVSAAFEGQAAALAPSLRAQPMEVEIIPGGAQGMLRYRITDKNTDTVMAERDLDPNLLNASQPGGGIVFRGLSISLSTMPKIGDRFVLDGNKDGAGNNDNMRALASLETLKLVGGSKTLGAAYIDHVNDMGNISRQAVIAKEALTVVRDQAAEARDKVSGVNLDEEAANLIRFQQAYQASAKVMQTASQLFDAVLQIA
ncbi:MAG: flagellar hook-associated protein FlgK [Betaproteobacteria bacterium]